MPVACPEQIQLDYERARANFSVVPGAKIKGHISAGALEALTGLGLCGVGGAQPSPASRDAITFSQYTTPGIKYNTSWQALKKLWPAAWHTNFTLAQEEVGKKAQQLGPHLRRAETWGVGFARLLGAVFKQTSLIIEIPLRGLSAIFGNLRSTLYDLVTSNNTTLKVLGVVLYIIFWPLIVIGHSLSQRLANGVAYAANLTVKTWDMVVDFVRLIFWGISCLAFGKPTGKQVIAGPLRSLILSFSNVVLNAVRLAPEATMLALYFLFPPLAALIDGLYHIIHTAASGALYYLSSAVVSAITTMLTVEAALAVPAQVITLVVNKTATVVDHATALRLEDESKERVVDKTLSSEDIIKDYRGRPSRILSKHSSETHDGALYYDEVRTRKAKVMKGGGRQLASSFSDSSPEPSISINGYEYEEAEATDQPTADSQPAVAPTPRRPSNASPITYFASGAPRTSDKADSVSGATPPSQEASINHPDSESEYENSEDEDYVVSRPGRRGSENE